MAGLLSAQQALGKLEKYLIAEIANHERDIATNQGKVQENKELLTRVQNTCLYCGEYVYYYSDEDRMGKHVKDKHQEPELSQG